MRSITDTERAETYRVNSTCLLESINMIIGKEKKNVCGHFLHFTDFATLVPKRKKERRDRSASNVPVFLRIKGET